MARSDESTAEGFALVAIVVAALSMVGAIIGIGFGVRAMDEADDRVAAGPAAATAEVHLSEFKIEPAELTVAAGAVLTVTNDGTTQHDFTVIGTDTKTELLDPGTSAELDLSALPAGSYQVMCSVPGHAAAGMTGQLTITGEGGGGGGTATPPAAMTPEEMDAAAHARVAAFPAKTAGTGAAPMEPEVLADGTKVFALTASVFDWEVEPGRTVEAWGYNGTVPGPTIKVNTGDKVRITIKNELPESTTIHFHGIEVPNQQDGVPDVTQPQIKVGETYSYEFTAIGPAVGMYHAHSDSQVQVPKGLLGPFLIDDMPLPPGMTVDQQVNMVLNDAGEIGMSINGKSFPATAPIVEKLGGTFLVNYFNEGFLIHPMHLHGPNQLVIAKDGNPLPAPYKADTLLIAPGERYTVLVTPNHVGTWVFHCHILNHAEATDGFYGMTTALVVNE
jgi:FtsP/CotA-like multicopper oxidase with cupredoxin domain